MGGTRRINEWQNIPGWEDMRTDLYFSRMISDVLKEHTKMNHQLLEKKLVARMRAMRNEADYAALLGVFYSYFGGLEVLINHKLDTSLLPDHAQRRKTLSLAKDLEALGCRLPQLAGDDRLPAIGNNSRAFGALYVIEGSTLGGQIIAQMIRKQLNITEGLTFFEGYGEKTMAMWENFKLSLNSRAELDATEVVQTANETFWKFSEWID